MLDCIVLYCIGLYHAVLCSPGGGIQPLRALGRAALLLPAGPHPPIYQMIDHSVYAIFYASVDSRVRARARWKVRGGQAACPRGGRASSPSLRSHIIGYAIICYVIIRKG